MQTWFFQLTTDPLTGEQVEALGAGGGEMDAVSLSPHADGTVMVTVEAERLIEAFRLARDRVDETLGERPRITALNGALADTVADTVFRAADRLHREAARPIDTHLAELWAAAARDMACHRAFEEQYYKHEKHGDDWETVPSRKFVVRPSTPTDWIATEVMTTWTLIYNTAKDYLDGVAAA